MRDRRTISWGRRFLIRESRARSVRAILAMAARDFYRFLRQLSSRRDSFIDLCVWKHHRMADKRFNPLRTVFLFFWKIELLQNSLIKNELKYLWFSWGNQLHQNITYSYLYSYSLSFFSHWLATNYSSSFLSFLLDSD